MLDYTSIDIQRAIRRKLITKRGAQLFYQFELQRKKLNSLYPLAFRQLNSKSKVEIKELIMTLSKEEHF
jgi:hypothetical protein